MKQVKKLLCATLALFLILPLTACGGNKYKGMSDEEKLITVGTWERQYSPNVTMTFNKNGKGSQQNAGMTYEYNWELDGDELDVDVIGWWEIDYEFKMDEESFTITNPEAKTSAVFVYGGSQPKELPGEGEKPKELIGMWVNAEAGLNSYVFKEDGTAYTTAQGDVTDTHLADLKWIYDKNNNILYTQNTANGNLTFIRYSIEKEVLSMEFLSGGKTYKYTKQK